MVGGVWMAPAGIPQYSIVPLFQGTAGDPVVLLGHHFSGRCHKLCQHFCSTANTSMGSLASSKSGGRMP